MNTVEDIIDRLLAEDVVDDKGGWKPIPEKIAILDEAKQALEALFEYVIGKNPVVDPHHKDWCRLDKLYGASKVIDQQRQRLDEVMGKEVKNENV